MTSTEERFLKDVAQHSMQVIHSDGVYRQIRFQQPEHSWLHRFDLITWPGYLCITGDCGTYVFSRSRDMFEFFRHGGTSTPGVPLYINESYWAEKLEASDCNGRNANEVRTWSEEKFEDWIKARYIEHVRQEMAGMPKERKELRRELKELVLQFSNEKHEALAAARDFDEHGLSFDSYWDVDFTDWDYGFIWCLYAIAWGIRQFDAQCPMAGAAQQQGAAA